MTKEELKEKLAEIEHQRWSNWHKYSRLNWTPEMIVRWDKQAETLYSNLTEKEKDSDRKEVEKYFPLIEQFIKNQKMSFTIKDKNDSRA